MDNLRIEADRREKYTFQIEMRLLFDWLPVMGSQGYALYSLYVALFTYAGVCQIGMGSMADFFGVHHRTVAFYNRLLEICGLIQVIREQDARGNKKTNRYEILATPEVSQELLDKIKKDLLSEGIYLESTHGRKFLRATVKRIDNYIPLNVPQPIFRRPAPGPDGQASLFDADLITGFLDLGMNQEDALTLINAAPTTARPGLARRWLRWAQAKSPDFFTAGAFPYLKKCISNGDEPPTPKPPPTPSPNDKDDVYLKQI